MKSVWCLSILSVLALSSPALAAPVRVCVSVEPKQWAATSTQNAAAVAPATLPSETAVSQSLPVAAVSASPFPAADPTPGAAAAPVVQGPVAAEVVAPVTQPVVVGPLAPSQRRAEPMRVPPAPVPSGIDPELYLQRLLAYQVTHHPRYEAVEKDCKQRLVVELYALDRGFTVFARFSEHAREEKVDHVHTDEFGALADRLVRALLDDVSVQETLDRENVLRIDSEERIRRVRSQRHFSLAMGTALRMGKLPTGRGNDKVEAQRRVMSPLALTIGARNKFRGFALDPFARLELGTQEYVPASDAAPGGHVDFTGSGAFGLHFIHYLSPRGIGSPYFGGGSQFELARYSVTERGKRGRAGEHDYFLSGGFNADLLVGYEFMRASSLHFFVQLEGSLPAYAVDSKTRSGGVSSAYVPSVVAQAGLLL